MTRRQWGILAVIFVCVAVIAGGVVALVSSSGDDGSISADGSTSSSSSTSSTLPPVTAPPVTAPPVTVGPDTAPPTIKPGSTIIVPTAPTTPPTKPPVTTTKPPVTTTNPSASTDVGITPTQIHLAVIADSTDAFEGMSAWAEAANKHPIAGRKVVLDLLSTNGTAEGYAAAVQTACDQDFAIVGSFSAFDIDSDAAGCGIAIPDLPVEATGTAHGVASNTFAAFPRRPATEAVGPYAWIKSNVGGCCAQYWLVPASGPSRGQTLASVDGAVKAGFTTAGTADVSANDPPSRYDEVVADLVNHHATFAASGLGAESTVLLRKAAGADAPDVKAWFCGSSCYDRAFLTAGGGDVNGEFVAIETTPFSDKTNGVKSYKAAASAAGNQPSYQGLRSYVTGRLFEQTARSVVGDHGDNGLTRVRLLAGLGALHDFSGDGIVGATDVGARTPNGCYVLLQVKNGHFVRTNPANKGTLDCGPQNLVEIGD